MTTRRRYCTSCGAPVSPGNRFCNQCGHPVSSTPPSTAERPSSWSAAQTPPPPPAAARRSSPQPATAGEPIVGVVAVGKPKGMLGMRHDTYNMIVTPRHLVFAYVSPELMKATVNQAREEAKQEGKGLLGRWGAQLGWIKILHRQYASMTMDGILSQYPGSFVIPNHQVQRVRYKSNWDTETAGQNKDELILKTTRGKQRFRLLSGNLRQVKKLLRQTLGRVA